MGLNHFPVSLCVGPICFRCYLHGHFSYECPNAVVCNRCGLPGHKSSECQKRSSLTRRSHKAGGYLKRREYDLPEKAEDDIANTLMSIKKQLDDITDTLLKYEEIYETIKEFDKEDKIKCTSAEPQIEFKLCEQSERHMVGPSVPLTDLKMVRKPVFYDGRQYLATFSGSLVRKTVQFVNVLQVPHLPVNIISQSMIESRGGEVFEQRQKQKVVVRGGDILFAAVFKDGSYIWDASDQFG
jgi:Zinc knuckle